MIINDDYNSTIAITQCAITNDTCKLSKDFDFNSVLELMGNHGTINMLYYGLKNSDTGSALADEIFPLVYQNILVDEAQKREVNKICTAFVKNHIDHAPLKGSRLKQLYPTTDMRSMGDADILIKTEQYDKIREIMLSLGYCEKGEGAHDYAWYNDNLYVELHKSLFGEYRDVYPEVDKYYKNSWSLMHPTGNKCEFAFTPEDEFIYLFAHFTKHYKLSGIGIRHLTDLWVFYCANPSIDLDYVKESLKAMGLLTFFENVWNTALCWFDGRNFDDMTEYISNEILSGGSFGTLENQVLSDFINKSEPGGTSMYLKFKRNLKYIFLPYKAMAVKYPLLNKLPIALPITWAVRLIDIALNKRQTLSNYIAEEKFVSSDKIEKRKKSLEYVGLKNRN